MKEYDINIVETLEKTVTVKADSYEEARQMVEDSWHESEYILDAENFTGVDFSLEDERELELEQGEMIDALLVKPFEYPQKVQIGLGLKDLQQAVDGMIEVVYPFAEEVGMIVNDEGKINGMPLNRAMYAENGEMTDIVAGNFLVVGLTEDNFCSLTDEQMERYEKRFHQPETFMRMGQRIIALPIPDERVRKPETEKAEKTRTSLEAVAR